MRDYKDRTRLLSAQQKAERIPQIAEQEILVRHKEKNSSQQGWFNSGRNCPERLWDLHPWRHERLDWTQPWAIWCNFKVSSAQGREVRPNHHQGPSKLKYSRRITFLWHACMPECQVTLILTWHSVKPQELAKTVIKQTHHYHPQQSPTQHR